MTLAEVNALDRAGFVAALGPVFEHSPWIAEHAWTCRPFASRDDLLAAMAESVRGAGVEAQFALICAHPDLAQKVARGGALTPHSAHEQSGAGLDRLTAEEFDRFHRLNDAYRAKFGFPFIICVRAHDRVSILAAFETRLAHDAENERATALSEIGEIARFRLYDLVSHA